MSLRSFHLAFILLVIVGADLFGAWAVHESRVTDAASWLWLGIVTLLGGLGLCWYVLRFVRTMDKAGVH